MRHEDCIAPGSELQLSPSLPVGLSDVELDELFASCLPKLAKAARKMLRNPEDSEDALQDGLLSAFQNLGQFQGRSKFSTWLHSIVRNAAKMQVRKQGSRLLCSLVRTLPDEDGSPIENLAPDFQPDPEQLCLRSERSRILRSALKELSPRYQSVIQLCDIEGMEGKDAAAVLGMSLNSLKTSLHRARRLVSGKIRHRYLSRHRCSPNTPQLEICPARQPNLRSHPKLSVRQYHPRRKAEPIRSTARKNWKFTAVHLARLAQSLPEERVA